MAKTPFRTLIMHKKIITMAMILGLLAVVPGCAGLSARINRLSVGADKTEARRLLGNNFKTLASKVDAQGRVLDLWEICDKETNKRYVIYFLDGRISQWGNKEELNNFPDLYLPK